MRICALWAVIDLQIIDNAFAHPSLPIQVDAPGGDRVGLDVPGLGKIWLLRIKRHTQLLAIGLQGCLELLQKLGDAFSAQIPPQVFVKVLGSYVRTVTALILIHDGLLESELIFKTDAIVLRIREEGYPVVVPLH